MMTKAKVKGKDERGEKLDGVRDLGQELVNLMGVKGKVEVDWDEENEAVKVQVTSEESGLLIGRHGATIEALQVVLSAMVARVWGEWVRVVCNVGDYREQREETLVQVALNTAKKAKFSGEAQTLTGLTPAERRMVHLTLVDEEGVETFSEGEEEERQLVVRPKA